MFCFPASFHKRILFLSTRVPDRCPASPYYSCPVLACFIFVSDTCMDYSHIPFLFNIDHLSPFISDWLFFLKSYLAPYKTEKGTEQIGLPECKTSRKFDNINQYWSKIYIGNLRSSSNYPHKYNKGKILWKDCNREYA